MKKFVVIAMVSVLLIAISAMAGDVTLRWDEPTKNADGSALTYNSAPASQWDLNKYLVFYGRTTGGYGAPIDAGRPASCGTFPSAGKCTFVVPGLEPGAWYFAVKAANVHGNQSEFSNEVSKTIEAMPCAPVLRVD